MNFLQSIKDGNPTAEAHRNLLRFGKGVFDREQIAVRKTKTQIDVSTGFEYYLTLYRLFLDFTASDDIQVKGVVMGPKQQIQRLLEDMGIQPSKLFGKKFTLDYVAKRSELEELLARIGDTSGHLLLTLKADSAQLTAKTTFPKPGKLVEKFCRLKAPITNAVRVSEELMIPPFKKKAVIETVYDIRRIQFDDALLTTDPARARLESKRDVEVRRTITIDDEAPIAESFSAVV